MFLLRILSKNTVDTCLLLLYGLDKLMQEKTGINCVLAEDPLTAVAIGTGKFIDIINSDDDDL